MAWLPPVAAQAPGPAAPCAAVNADIDRLQRQLIQLVRRRAPETRRADAQRQRVLGQITEVERQRAEVVAALQQEQRRQQALIERFTDRFPDEPPFLEALP